jgi:hypothetical protein
MKRATLAIAVLAVLACLVGSASAAGGTQASLAANVAATTVGYYPYAVYRPLPPFYRPVYRPRVWAEPVVVAPPVFAPPPVVVREPILVGPRVRPFLRGPVVVETPFVSVGVGY